MVNQSAPHFSNLSQSLLLCVLPLIAFAIAAYPLSGWLIDDAGISFAYARNLAAGAGFVSQPGRVPVEGFSNPLWTQLFVPGFWLSPNAPVLTAKFFGHLFSYGAFFFCFQIVLRITRSPLFGCLTTILLALSPPFVIWNVSGLENWLYAFEIVALAYLCLLTLDHLSWRVAVIAGLLAAAALTRPDGIIFIVLWPAAIFLQSIRDRKFSPASVRNSAAYIASAVLPIIAYKGMALAYFGALLPNTYYAKGAPGLDGILGVLLLDSRVLAKGYLLFWAPFGFAWFALGTFLVAFLFCVYAKRLVAPLDLLASATALALAAYLFLPNDWMPEFRFGTAFVVLFYPTLFSLLWVAGAALPKTKYFGQQFPAFLAAGLIIAASVPAHHVRFTRFIDAPTVPFSEISELYGERFNRAAEILDVENASFLLPDLGGLLFYSDLELFDLAGLTDKTIARIPTSDTASLHRYIFSDVKPTFIHVHEFWAYLADLDGYSEFRKQYIPIREVVDPDASQLSGRTVYSGDYVRRDVVENRPSSLAQIRTVLYGSP